MTSRDDGEVMLPEYVEDAIWKVIDTLKRDPQGPGVHSGPAQTDLRDSIRRYGQEQRCAAIEDAVQRATRPAAADDAMKAKLAKYEALLRDLFANYELGFDVDLRIDAALGEGGGR